MRGIIPHETATATFGKVVFFFVRHIRSPRASALTNPGGDHMKREYPYGTGPVKLVSSEWLDSNMKKTDLVIADIQPSIHDYLNEHIPGAVYLNEGLLRMSIRGIPGYFVPPESVQPAFRSLGIRKGVPVVVYTAKGAFSGEGDGLGQTMAAYALARFGHDSVYVLDGGLDKWKEEGRALTKEYAKVRESDFNASLRNDYFIGYEDFKSVKDSDHVIVLDARPRKVYEGQGPWMKPGHIPGAVNLPWTDFMDENNRALLKPEEEISAIINSKGITPDKTIICSCGTGREGTNEFLLFKFFMNYPRVMLYEGSFTEWVAYPENETVTGANPRKTERTAPVPF